MKSLLLSFILTAFCTYTARPQAKLGRMLAERYSAMEATATEVVLITFTDKGNAHYRPKELLSARSLARRAKARPPGPLIDEADYPLNQAYVRAIEPEVVAVRHQLKWFNAVSAVATKEQIDRLLRLPFVRRIDLVGRWKAAGPKEPLPEYTAAGVKGGAERPSSLDYGNSYQQLQQINVPAVHALGLYGQGVMICMFDEGVRNPTDPIFDSVQIIAMHDFVDHKESVVPYDPTAGGHGQMTLTQIGAYAPGYLVGPAFRASFLLARTENDSSETPIEEDNWAAGIQWADSIGVDVTSTSLAYLQFDSPYPSMTWQDMDGQTAIISQAANRADSLGIMVVNAAGNAGRDSTHNTLWAPADAPGVLTIGAVDTGGAVLGFSSNGPTIDGRIKPDVMALGLGGTSAATPLAAGVAALILCAHPGLTPEQVREAMRSTASDALSPDNFHGWGVVNALAAVQAVGITNHLSGVVFHDRNGNGRRDMDEETLPGVTVALSGTAAGVRSTDNQGRYLFDSLSLGPYSVGIDSQPGFFLSPVSRTYSLTLDSSGRVAADLNFGFFATATVRGSVFLDLNRNGVHDGGEPPMAEWPLSLSGPVNMVTFTDSNGNYQFSGLGPGSYVIRDSAIQFWHQTAPGGETPLTFQPGSGTDTTLVSFGNGFFPAEPFTVVTGWNMVSMPYLSASVTRNALFQSALSNAFTYVGRYTEGDTISVGKGYWLKFPADATLPVFGWQVLADTVPVTNGWNMIGSVSFPIAVASLGSIPPGMILGGVFGYVPDNGYALTDSIHPGKGYWVRCDSAGSIILSVTPGPSANRVRLIPGSELPPPPPDSKPASSPSGMVPSTFALERNYPNPFNPTTKIRYQLPVRSRVSLRVFNLLGQEVATLVDGVEEAGYRTVEWSPSGQSSGVYYCRMESTPSGDPSKTVVFMTKMLLVR